MLFSRKEVVIAGLMGTASLFLPSCFQGKESQMTNDIRDRIKKDMAEVGLDQEWYKLKPFQEIPNDIKIEFGGLPKSGLFALDSDKKNFYFIFSVPHPQKKEIIYVRIKQPIDRKEPEAANVEPQVKVNFDLSKFYDPKTQKVLKFQSAEDYVEKIEGSVVSVELRGRPEDLGQIELLTQKNNNFKTN